MVNMMRVLLAHHTLDVENKINVNMIRVHKIIKLWVDNNEGIVIDLWYWNVNNVQHDRVFAYNDEGSKDQDESNFYTWVAKDMGVWKYC